MAQLVKELPANEKVRFYMAGIDTTGIQVTVGDREIVVPFT